MTKLNWDAGGERIYEAGVDRGVFYPQSGPGLAWPGLISVSETNEETRSTVGHIDGSKYINRQTSKSFTGLITAFTYPEEFEPYDGYVSNLGSQKKQSFGFSYRTMMGPDRYQIHLIYNAMVRPTVSDYETVDDFTQAINFSWNLTSRSVAITDLSPSSHLIIDVGASYANTLTALEDILYGSDEQTPRLPPPDEVIALFESMAVLKITDNGDGTWTADGPDEVVSMIGPDEFQIDWPSVVYLSPYEFQVSTW